MPVMYSLCSGETREECRSKGAVSIVSIICSFPKIIFQYVQVIFQATLMFYVTWTLYIQIRPMLNPCSPGTSSRSKTGKMSREKFTGCSKTTQAVLTCKQPHKQAILQKSSQQYAAFYNQPFGKTLTSSSMAPALPMILSLVSFNVQSYRVNGCSFLCSCGC